MKIDIKKRYFFGLILFVGIYFVVALAPVPVGHTINEIELCGAEQILKMNSAGTSWTCSDDSSPVFQDPQAVDFCSVSGGQVTSPGVCLFKVAGMYTFTAPSGVDLIEVTIVGAGGGSGSRAHGHWNAYGGAGGGGAVRSYSLTGGHTFSLTVGKGGYGPTTAGWGNRIGEKGGSTVFGGMSATGGAGGYSAGYNTPVSGGVGSGGTTNCNGGVGKNANYQTAVGGVGGCGGGSGGPSGAGGASTSIGGNGGSAICGAGGSMSVSDRGGDGCIRIVYK